MPIRIELEKRNFVEHGGGDVLQNIVATKILSKGVSLLGGKLSGREK